LQQDLVPWLRLGLTPGIGSATVIRLLTAFGSLEAVLACGRQALAPHLTPTLAEALSAGPDPALLEQTLAWLLEPGNSLLTLADSDFPRPLLEIADPPVATPDARDLMIDHFGCDEPLPTLRWRPSRTSAGRCPCPSVQTSG